MARQGVNSPGLLTTIVYTTRASSEMPQELLTFPPYYCVVGVYRLFTDASLRKPVWDKVKHATVRGLVVGTIYVVLTYRVQRWFVGTFLLGGFGLFGGRTLKTKPPPAVVGHSLGWMTEMDIVDYTTILFILPQLTSLLYFFVKRNLRIARSRAWDLTVASRNKPDSFWSMGYVEEWEQPPRVSLNGKGGKATLGARSERWLSWVMWWPSQMLIRHFVLIPISPFLPIVNLLFTAGTRGLYTARHLHEPYFARKRMTPLEVELWLEERKWGYRSFGFAAALLEQMPIVGLAFSVSNRIGAAMWAFDLEKRSHRVASGELPKLRPDEVGMGAGVDRARDAVDYAKSGRGKTEMSNDMMAEGQAMARQKEL